MAYVAKFSWRRWVACGCGWLARDSLLAQCVAVCAMGEGKPVGRFFPGHETVTGGVEPEEWLYGEWEGRGLRAMWGCPPKPNTETGVRVQVQDGHGTWREVYRQEDQGRWWVFRWTVVKQTATLRNGRLLCFLRDSEKYVERDGQFHFEPFHSDHLTWDPETERYVRHGGEVEGKDLPKHGKKHGADGGLAKAANQKSKKAATEAKLAAARAEKARRKAT